MTAKQVWVPLTITLLSLIALGPMPFGYYQLLRVAVCAACIYNLIEVSQHLGFGYRLGLGALAVLYNPILRVPLASKLIWSLVNLATVAFLWMVAMPAKNDATRHGGSGGISR